MGIFSKVMQKNLVTDEDLKVSNPSSPQRDVFLYGRANSDLPPPTPENGKNGATKVSSNGHSNGQSNGHSNGHSNGNDFGNPPAHLPRTGKKSFEPPEFIRDLENVTIGKPLLAEILAESERGKSSSNGQSATAALNGKAQPGTIGVAVKVSELTSLPDFPVMEITPERVEPHIVAITQPRSPFCEEYRSLRTSLMQANKRKNVKAVVISSTLPGEGKSVTSLNLAWLLAQTDGVRALVIDSDLRLPSLDDYLGIKADKGLSDVLDEELTWQETIIKLNPAGLFLMPGGTPRDDVAEQLSGPKFKRILDEARAMFDFIIIDAPPLGIFTDAAVLTDYADGAMLVIKAGKARYSKVTRLLEVIPKERILGVVLNCSEQELEESHYYYYERERVKNTAAA